MSKIFTLGDYPPGTTLKCVASVNTEHFTVGEVYLVQEDGRLTSKYGYERATISKFEVVTGLISVELTPLLSQLRVYEAGKSYANRDDYKGIVTVQYLTADTVYLSGAHGDITDATRKLAFDKLKAVGVKQIKYEHHGLQHTVDI